jgi:dTDP-4-dehydrorhamnose 3,5-epimerase
MKVTPTAIPEVLVIEPKVFGDDRGFFFESFSRKVLAEAIGIDVEFVQDNHSRSVRNVLRGLHYQLRRPQHKLVRVIAGEVFDVAVDIRKGSPTYGKWVGEILSGENRKQLFVPVGFAHGFVTLSESAELLYKASDYYAPAFERCIRWDDPNVGISWPISRAPHLSGKDSVGVSIESAETFARLK